MPHPNANATQRARRKRTARVDYFPTPEAGALMESLRGSQRPWNTNSGILNAIVAEWAALTGGQRPRVPGINPHTRANDFGPNPILARLFSNPAECGARTRSGQPCHSTRLGKGGKCKWHGGRSTGPRTADGKARALMNLSRGRPGRPPSSETGPGDNLDGRQALA